MKGRHVEARRRSEQGIALVVALMNLLILFLVGAGIVIAGRASQNVGTAFKNQQSAFEVAVAGLNRAAEAIRKTRFDAAVAGTNSTFSAMLASAANGGSLVNSQTIAGFGATNGFTNATANTPIALPTPTLDGSGYKVFITNDVGEGVTNTTDNNDSATLTAFGSGANAVGFSVVQGVFQPGVSLSLPSLPGLLTMPGPTVDLSLPHSQPAQMDGDSGATPRVCFATVAVSTAGALGTAETEIPTNRQSDYTTCNPANGAIVQGDPTAGNMTIGTNPYDGSTNNTPVYGPPGGVCPPGAPANCLTRVDYLTALRDQIKAGADFKGANGWSDPNAPGFSLGTAAQPRMIAINGDYSIGGGAIYYGLLLVTGNLTINGGAVYHGAIYNIGNGNVERNGGGGGNGNMCGAILIADIVNPVTVNGVQLAGEPSFRFTGGGNSVWASACAPGADGDLIRFSRPLNLISFEHLL